MAPTVTYNGIQGAQGGNIFKDVKFWVAHRVPMRNHFVELIKQNGGFVVPLEKQADMLIADHMKEDKAPPGSYTWKFIEDSIQNGIIQIKDKYRIGPDPDLPRPVGANRAAKSTRTPFTPDDDARLAKWVLSHPSPQSGNAIYQEYEKINPRHTWQSWRDRFVKKIKTLTLDEMERLAASAPAEPDLSEDSTEQPITTQTTHVATEMRSQSAGQATERRTVQPSRSVAHPESVPQRPERSSQQPPQCPAIPPQENIKDSQVQAPSSDEPEDLEDAQARQTFYEDLEQYIVVSGAEIKSRLNINGKIVEMFDLAMAASGCRVRQDSQMVDWFQVAENLGFENPSDDIATHLQVCYDDNLKEFVSVMEDFALKDEGQAMEADFEPGFSENQGSRDDQEAADDQIRSQLPQSYVRSSPPVGIAGIKRSAGQRPLSSSGPGAKRRRFRRDEEIPSTPDVQLGAKATTVEHVSPSARKSSQWREYVDESEASQYLPPLPPVESQDLGTGQSPGPNFEDQSPGATQQHHQMLDTPIPFALNKSREQGSRPALFNRHTSQSRSSNISRESSLREVAAPEAVSTTRPKQINNTRRSLPTSFKSAESGRSRQTTATTPRRRHRSSFEKTNYNEIWDWKKRYMDMGYPEHIVVEALRRTTLSPGNLALKVMEDLKNGRGVSDCHQGIWTDNDDKMLKIVSAVNLDGVPSGSAKDRRRAQQLQDRLIRKHGAARVEIRKKYLDQVRMEEEQYLER
ncbi:hypothetical protein FALBO_11510 [Fusarium albosuccineum]|uniref:DNA-binding protein RAP1 n=1 Tax=Fusarium albosuccineum TaxID=1237068 RepID=A0A8H4L521_9HYPO|nr:hypothetical protein FALBO_11510 [Fusarium albosuccineum]